MEETDNLNNKGKNETCSFGKISLKPEILKAIDNAGFEHPSEVQDKCIPLALKGSDLLCQAQSGMGKTAVFVFTTLQLLDFETNEVCALIMCPTRELVFQISKQYERFSMHMPLVKVSELVGGSSFQKSINTLTEICPQIVVGTPGRILSILKKQNFFRNLKFFILDECDKLMDQIDMRQDVEEIFRATNQDKQVMMFSATIPSSVRPLCKKFMKNPSEFYVDKQKEISHMNRLVQHYIKIKEINKEAKLYELLDALEYNQAVVFVNPIISCSYIADLLRQLGFSVTCAIREDRTQGHLEFKNLDTRILVATDILARGIDFEKVNIVINYDMPDELNAYIHRIGRTGRFGRKGLVLSFISGDRDGRVLAEVMEEYGISITELPDEIEVKSYLSDI